MGGGGGDDDFDVPCDDGGYHNWLENSPVASDPQRLFCSTSNELITNDTRVCTHHAAHTHVRLFD